VLAALARHRNARHALTWARRASCIRLLVTVAADEMCTTVPPIPTFKKKMDTTSFLLIARCCALRSASSQTLLELSEREARVRTSFAQDGGTSLRICDAAGKAAGCIPGCYTEQGNHYPVPDGVPCWCDTGVTQCASGHGATGPSACAWKPDELSKMLTKQAHFNSYNELLFDTTAYAAALPGSLEAFFIMAESQQDQKNMTSEQHAHFLSTYGRTAQQTPLLVFDPTNLAKPFSCVTC
jgi:hypothetical protein